MTKMVVSCPTLVGGDEPPNTAPALPWTVVDPAQPNRAPGFSAVSAELAMRIADLEQQVAAANAKVANLELALQTNRRIGAAIGIVMALNRLTEAEAFDVLKQASQHRNCKLRILADEVLLTGEVQQWGQAQV